MHDYRLVLGGELGLCFLWRSRTIEVVPSNNTGNQRLQTKKGQKIVLNPNLKTFAKFGGMLTSYISSLGFVLGTTIASYTQMLVND